MSKLLSDTAITQYRKDGYYFPVRMIDAAQAAAYRAKLETFEASRGEPVKGPLRNKCHLLFKWVDDVKPVALKNRRVVYNLLFKAASATLLELAADPKRLGAQIGLTAVLHTWGQNLLLHPHLHCVVTGDGLSRDTNRWVPARAGYLLPGKVVSKLFRGKFLAGLKQAYEEGQLTLRGSVAPLARTRHFGTWLAALYRQDWVVYAKPPFGGAEQVFRYLARYIATC